MTDHIEVQLEEQPIELCKLLKVLDLVEGGGQAKQLISDGYVGVNYETCTVRRKKLYAGDILHFEQDSFELTLAPNAITKEPTKREKATSNTPATTKANNAKNSNLKSNNAKKAQPKKGAATDKKTGRKPISFG